jgi:hypothetical protein
MMVFYSFIICYCVIFIYRNISYLLYYLSVFILYILNLFLLYNISTLKLIFSFALRTLLLKMNNFLFQRNYWFNTGWMELTQLMWLLLNLLKWRLRFFNCFSNNLLNNWRYFLRKNNLLLLYNNNLLTNDLLNICLNLLNILNMIYLFEMLDNLNLLNNLLMMFLWA